MAHSLFKTLATLSFATAAFIVALPPALGQEVPPEIANAKNSAVGQVNADAVYVRSGAGDNYYPTMKLNTGTEVTVVGVKFDWLKVIPPQGSFCYIAKAFVDKVGAGDPGTVNRDDVNVRAGSALNAMKTTVASKLSSGQQVKIIGEQDEYYKIVPPADAFVYVKKDLVNFVKAQPQVAVVPPKTPEAPVPAAPTGTQVAAVDPATVTTPEVPGAIAGTATTQPSDLIVAAPPTTQPLDASASAATTQPALTAEAKFDKLESDYTTASAKPIEQQPVTELLGGYQKLIADPQLPESMRRVADFRTKTLQARAEARDQFASLQKDREEAKKRTQALVSEQEEIAQQIKKADVQIFAAVGTLRTSSIQKGEQLLYRLTDPQNGRTVCYISSNDSKIGGMIGQFIGVKGEVSTDPQLMLKLVKATDQQVVDPNQVFRGVAPMIAPPSMIPAAAGTPQQASATSGQQ